MYVFNKILLFLDKVLKRPNLVNGFQEIKPKRKDYKHKPEEFGAVLKTVLFPNAQSDFYRPEGELQKRGDRDKLACVTYGEMNCRETIINFYIAVTKDKELQKQFKSQELYEIKEIVKIFEYFELIKNGQADFSDRYIAKLSGTGPRGNNQNNVAQAVRHYGLVPESLYPYVHDYNEYYKEVPAHIIAQGKKLLDYIKFSHEWVNPKHFNSERRYGPIQTSIHAGAGWGNGKIYPPTKLQRNHVMQLDSYEWKKWDGAFDSYNPFSKKLSWYSNLGYGKLFTTSLIKPISKFNEKEIKQVKKKWDYIVLVENYKNFDRGIYKLNDTNLEKVPTSNAVKKWVATLKEGNKIEGVNADFFSKLIT